MTYRLNTVVMLFISMMWSSTLYTSNIDKFTINKIKNFTKNVKFKNGFNNNLNINYKDNKTNIQLELLKNNITEETKNKSNQSSSMKNKHFITKNKTKALNNQANTYRPVDLPTEEPFNSKREISKESGVELINFKNVTHIKSQEASYYLDTEEDTEETSSEMARAEEVEREANKVKKILFALEKSLYETFEKVPVGGGDELITDLIEYNRELNTFLNMAVADKVSTYDVVKDFLDPNNPIPHVARMDYSIDLFEKNFKWTEKEYKKFKQNLKNTTETYLELQLNHHEFPYR